MRHRKQKIHLGRTLGSRTALLRNLATSVVLHERVRTTSAKARAVQPLVERCIRIARQPSLTHRRQLMSMLGQPRAVAKLLEVLGPRYQERASGWTRRLRLGKRQGDAASMEILELV